MQALVNYAAVIALSAGLATAAGVSDEVVNAGETIGNSKSEAVIGSSKRSPVKLIEQRLKDLVGQQESWYVKEARYGRDAYKIGMNRPGDSVAFAEVQVEILFASKRGWTAIGAHPAAPGKTCVVFVGFRDKLPVLPRTHESAKEAMLEGRPECD